MTRYNRTTTVLRTMFGRLAGAPFLLAVGLSVAVLVLTLAEFLHAPPPERQGHRMSRNDRALGQLPRQASGTPFGDDLVDAIESAIASGFVPRAAEHLVALQDGLESDSDGDVEQRTLDRFRDATIDRRVQYMLSVLLARHRGDRTYRVMDDLLRNGSDLELAVGVAYAYGFRRYDAGLDHESKLRFWVELLTAPDVSEIGRLNLRAIPPQPMIDSVWQRVYVGIDVPQVAVVELIWRLNDHPWQSHVGTLACALDAKREDVILRFDELASLPQATEDFIKAYVGLLGESTLVDRAERLNRFIDADPASPIGRYSFDRLASMLIHEDPSAATTYFERYLGRFQTDPSLASAALVQLGRARTTEGLDVIIRAYESSADSTVRSSAVNALRAFSSDSVLVRRKVDFLIRATSDHEPSVRIRAISVLNELDVVYGRALLQRAAENDPDSSVRRHAKDQLRLLGSP